MTKSKRKLGVGMNRYQRMAEETANYPRERELDGLDYATLGLAGEAGEVANKVKKVHRDDGCVLTDEKRHAIAEELGDVLWYVAMAAKEIGYSLDEVALLNYAKLRSRARRGKIGGSGDER